MKKFCILAAGVSIAAASIESLFEDDEISLMQLRAAKVEKHGLHRAESFGCTGEGLAERTWKCGEWGDPHRFTSWRGGDKDDNPNQVGWHWMAKSTDGQMKVQVFLAQSGVNLPVVAALAAQFGGTTFKILKRRENDVRGFKLIINGEEQTPDSPTKTFPDGFFVRPLNGRIGDWKSHGGAGQTGSNVKVCMDSADKRWTIRSDAYQWAGGRGGIPINMEIIADDANIDKGFASFCTRETPNIGYLVPDDEILVTAEENEELCSIELNDQSQCQNPPILPPLPPVEQLCQENGIAFADAEAACEGERDRGHGMFEGCVEDCCASGSLDDCTTGPEDFDALDDDETGDDTASAVDDPHIRTVHGHKYDFTP